MNYNDYDSNGNKKDFNFTDLMTDKKQRSRLILGIYVVLIIILIIMIRVGNKSNSSKDKVVKNNDVEEIKEEKPKDEYDELFSLIDGNNYEFRYSLTLDNDIYIAEGKRYSNKFNFTFVKEGEIPIEFLGTTKRWTSIYVYKLF